jgi:hypothetical protein
LGEDGSGGGREEEARGGVGEEEARGRAREEEAGVGADGQVLLATAHCGGDWGWIAWGDGGRLTAAQVGADYVVGLG